MVGGEGASMRMCLLHAHVYVRVQPRLAAAEETNEKDTVSTGWKVKKPTENGSPANSAVIECPLVTGSHARR